MRKQLGELTVNAALLDFITDVLGASSVDLAPNTEAGTEDLKDCTSELLGERLVGTSHGSGNVDDLIKRDGLGVLDVLLLLSVTRWLLESSDDERGGGWDD